MSHIVIQAEIQSGEKFVIDISGMQHGWHDSIYDSNVYMHNRVGRICSFTAIDFSRNEMKEQIIKNHPPFSWERGQQLIREEVCNAISPAINCFAAGKQTSLDALLSSRQDSFPAIHADLLRSVKERIVKAVGDLQARGMGREYFGPGPDHRISVTMSNQDVKKYKRVWLSQKTVAACKGDVRRLQNMWKKRAVAAGLF